MSEQITINLTQPQEEITFSYTEQGEEITFSFSEAARGPQGPAVTVDQTIIDGSTNAVSGNAVFDGLALKAPINNPTFTGIVTAPRITGRCDGIELLCKAGLPINAGQVVYITGASGSNIIIGLAQADSEPTSSKTIGISESTLATNATGYAITEGLMTVSISAPTANEGDPIWLSSTTAGGMVFGLANKPSAPNHIVYLGVVTRKTGNTVVEIYVKIQNGSELDELADVAITSPVAGQALMRGASLWENRSLVSADISDATASATANRIVKRNAQGGAEFAGTSSIAVSVTSTSATAVNAVSTNSTAIYGESGAADGGFFASSSGTGLAAFTDSGDYHAKFGDTSGDNRSFVARVSGAFGWWRGAFRGFLQAPASITSSDKTWTLPNNTGTVALTTDEMTPSAAGLTSKFGTNKASIVNGDKVTILDSAASDAPKHVLWSLIVSTLTTAFDALYVGLTGNQTVAGNKTLSGQLELTGQAATNSTSAMTRKLNDYDYVFSSPQRFDLLPRVAVTSTGGTSLSTSDECRLALNISTTSIGSITLGGSVLINQQSGGTLSYQYPFLAQFKFYNYIANSAAGESIVYRFYVGGNGTLLNLSTADPYIANQRGVGFELRAKASSASHEIRLFARDGTGASAGTLNTSAWFDIGSNTEGISFVSNAVIEHLPATSTVNLYFQYTNQTSQRVRISQTPTLTITGAGVPTDGAHVATNWANIYVQACPDGSTNPAGTNAIRVFPSRFIFLDN